MVCKVCYAYQCRCPPEPRPTDEQGILLYIYICHSNIRSLKQTCSTSGNNFKFNDVKFHLDNFDIITLSETWLTSGNSSDDYLIPGYQRPFRRDRGPDNGPPGYGGVIAWVSDKLACKRRNDLESNDLEALWLEVRSLNFKFFVCTLYRTSSNSDRSFWDKLQLCYSPYMNQAQSLSY